MSAKIYPDMMLRRYSDGLALEPKTAAADLWCRQAFASVECDSDAELMTLAGMARAAGFYVVEEF